MADLYIFSKKVVKAFYRNVRPVGPNFCWYWHGMRGVDGFGIFQFENRVLYAHVFAWMLDRKSLVPSGSVVTHSCQYPPCCSPHHLDLIPIQHNPIRLTYITPAAPNVHTDTSPHLRIAK